MNSNNNHRNVLSGRVCLYLLQYLISAHLRHLYVHDNQVRLSHAGEIDRLQAVCSFDNIVSRSIENDCEQLSGCGTIFNDENPALALHKALFLSNQKEEFDARNFRTSNRAPRQGRSAGKAFLSENVPNARRQLVNCLLCPLQGLEGQAAHVSAWI